MHLFDFQPGDGICYTFVFGRFPGPSPLVPQYTLFGYRDEYTELLTVYPFDNEHISYETFERRLRRPETNPVTFATAWRVWCELVDSPSEGIEAELPTWRSDWRNQLPLR